MPPRLRPADRREAHEQDPGAGELGEARRLAEEEPAHPQPADDDAPLDAGDGDPEAAFPQGAEVQDVAEDEARAPAEHEQRDRPPADEAGQCRPQVAGAVARDDDPRDDEDRHEPDQRAERRVDRRRGRAEHDVDDRVADGRDERPALTEPELDHGQRGSRTGRWPGPWARATEPG